MNPGYIFLIVAVAMLFAAAKKVDRDNEAVMMLLCIVAFLSMAFSGAMLLPR